MIYLCDFEDSFTFNIFSTLKLLDNDLQIELIPKNRILTFLQTSKSLDEKMLIILGPGPGHPSDYHYLFSSIVELLNKDNIFLCGICLGHQLIWSSMGAKVEHCHLPVHGQAKTYILPDSICKDLNLSKTIQVQHYNSLAVKEGTTVLGNNRDIKYFAHNDEIILSYSDRLLSYQFHPESIGTCFPEMFFRKLEKFLL